LELGFGLITCQRYPGDARTSADLYRESLELAKACEGAGLDSVWTSEHHFWDDDYMPSLLVMSAAMAAVTERIRIGTGVLLAPLYHPIRLAEDAAAVDLISGGRLILGLGLGWREEEFERLGIPREGLGRRLSETVKILRASWGAEVFEFDGRFFKFGPTNVTPKPTRQIPIWIGGFVDSALRRAGRIGDAYFGSSVPFEDMARRMEIVRRAIEKAGRDPAEFSWGVHEPVWVCQDPEREIEEFLPHFHYSRWKYRDMGPAFGRSSAGPLPQPPPLDEQARADLLKILIAGPPEDVAKRISEFRNVMGPDMHFVARSIYPGIPFERAKRCIELLGEVKRLLVT
jgi:probable F420-dependent oxidoreductase